MRARFTCGMTKVDVFFASENSKNSFCFAMHKCSWQLRKRTDTVQSSPLRAPRRFSLRCLPDGKPQPCK